MRVINEENKGRRFHAEVWDSYGEFVKYARNNDNPLSSDKHYDRKWHGEGSENLANACTLASDGWTSVRPQVDNLLTEVTERLADRLADLYKPAYDFGGAYVDMGRFVEGDPECMVSFHATSDRAIGRVVKVVVAGTASCDIEGDWLTRRGIAILALIDTVNKLGFGVELWWDSTISGDGGTYTTAVKLHDSSDTLDINSVMFSLAHPSMLRRLVFSVQEQSKYARQQGVPGGYGRPHDMGMPKLDNFDVMVEKLQNGNGDIVRRPMEWVMSTLKGLELIPATA